MENYGAANGFSSVLPFCKTVLIQRKSRMVFYIMRDFLYILKWLHGYRVKPQQKKAFKMLLQFFAGSLLRLPALQTETHGMKRAGRRCPK